MKNLYKKILQIGVYPENSLALNKQIEQSNSGHMQGILICTFSFLALLPSQSIPILVINLFIIVTGLINFALAHFRLYRIQKQWQFFPGLISTLFWSAWLGPGTTTVYYFLIMLAFAFRKLGSENTADRNFTIALTLICPLLIRLDWVPWVDALEPFPAQYVPLLNWITDFGVFSGVGFGVYQLTEINRKAEQELQKALEQVKNQQAQLAQSAKMGALGEMASGVAHEINNPLTIVLGSHSKLKRLVSQLPEGPSRIEIEKTLERAENNSVRIGKIIRGMRNFARDGGRDPLEEMTSTQAIQDALDLCEERLSYASISIRVQEDGVATFQARPTQITQILLNLVNNARDAIDAFPEKWIEISVCQVKNRLQFRVTDCGNGLPADVAEKIMQPFFTTKDAGQGTGLGLSISQQLANENGGKLYYDPQSPHTTFVLELPYTNWLPRSDRKSA
jgi:signal transduction histidine kinase